MVARGDELVLAVGRDRRIGIEGRSGQSETVSVSDTKRWGDDTVSRRDASIVRVSVNGHELSRQQFSAGLSIHAQGIELVDGEPILYGALGGMPAHTVPSKIPPNGDKLHAQKRTRSKTVPRQTGQSWITEILRSQ